MEHVAGWPEDQRIDLFKETGARRNMQPAVVEKDFWVCWVLGRLFASETLARKILFKGGTSLSKVFGLIERFSEDIDLILDWTELTRENPAADRSKTKQDRLNKKLLSDSGAYLSDRLLPEVKRLLGDVCEVTEDKNTTDVIDIRYPSAFSNEYLRPEVRLEIGPLASWLPNAEYVIHSYSAKEFPALFEEPSCRIRAIKAERSFWEKATILHQEAHRPESKPQPIRYSRHYYDMACMAKADVKQSALQDLELLYSVVGFIKKFYPKRWAKYELAVPGTFKLIPPAHLIGNLKKDYGDMRVMIFGEIPPLDEILRVLQELEDEINKGSIQPFPG